MSDNKSEEGTLTSLVGNDVDTYKESNTLHPRANSKQFSYKFFSNAGETQITSAVVTESGSLTESVIRKVKHEYPVELFGDVFSMSIDPHGVLLHHSTWPLGGEGKTFDEAIRDLLSTIRYLRSELLATPLHQLDSSAISLRNYLLTGLNV
jgi:hypothetical protein